MTNLSTSLHNALSGLNVLARVTETVSSNVANAATPGYGAREANLSQRVTGNLGQGVTVEGYTRHVDPVLLAERRFAEAELAKTSVQTDFYTKVTNQIGLPDSAGSLTGRLTQFHNSLIEAASRPDSEGRLQNVLDSAKSVANILQTLKPTTTAGRD